MGFLTKKERFTLCTPIPAFVPRQLAIDLLHDHSEVIEANPLVLAHWPTPCPSKATGEEYHALWYEITQRIQYVPGIGKKGASTINFTGCFQDRPWGLETHIYAPLGVDLRNTYRVAGFQPGGAHCERTEDDDSLKVAGATEGAPSEGLYLRTDVEVECSIGFAGFVRSQAKTALNKMVTRMVQRVETPVAKDFAASTYEQQSSLISPHSDIMPQSALASPNSDLMPRPLSVPTPRTTTTPTTTFAPTQGQQTSPGWNLGEQEPIYELPASERA